MTQNEYLLKGSVVKGLVKFAIPVLLANLLQVLYSATDLLIVGNYATTADVSAVSISSQIMTTVTMGLAGFTMGVSVLLGQFSGAKNERDMSRTAGTAIIFFAAAAVIIMVPLLVFRNGIISAMRTPVEAVIPARSYLTICASGIIFIVGYNLVSSMLRGLGNSRAPFLFVAISCCINIILDVTLVKGFGMGAKGAAIATIAAQGGSLLFSLLFLKKRGLGFKFYKEDIKLNWEIVKKICKIGAPLSLQEILVSFSFLLITAVVNRISLVASASVGIVEKLISFLMMPTIALSSAVATMCAQNYGAGQYERAKKSLYAGIGISFSIAVVISVFCWFSGSLLTSLFEKDADVIYNGSLYLKSYCLDCLAVAFVFNLNSYLASNNHSLFSMIHNLAATFFIRVPATIIFSQLPNVTLFTLGFAAPLSSLGSIIMCFIFLWYLKRKGVLDGNDDSQLPAVHER